MFKLKKLAVLSATLLTSFSFSSSVLASTEDDENQNSYSLEQKKVIDDLKEKEKEYKEYGMSAPVVGDFKSMERSIGSWSWRDGLICVTDKGLGIGSINTWHAGIVAPQKAMAIAEAADSKSPVRVKQGM